MAKDILFPNGAVFAVVPVDTDGDSVVDNVTNSVRVTSVGAASGDGAILDGVSSAIRATVFDFANSNPLAVNLRDINGDPASVGGGTQYTEDAVAPADPVGTAQALVRQDTPAGLVSADGDIVIQRATNFGAAYTQIVSSTGAFIDTFGGGTQYTEDDASATNPIGTQVIARRRDALISETTADGDVTAVNSTAKGELYVKHVDSIPVIGTITANQGTPNSVANSWPVQITDGVDSALVAAGALLVNNSGVIQPVMATDLDIRNLVFATDKVDASGTTLGANSGVDIGDVTINNAAGASAVNIQDGGNSITVDGTTDGAIVDGVSSAIRATVFDFTNSNPLGVTLRDTNGDAVSVGGGTQYTEDDAAPANPVGTAVALVRQDTPATLTTADGDIVAQRSTNYGAAYTQIVTSTGAFVDTFGGGTQYTEDDASATNPIGNQLIARRRDALITETTADGDVTALNSTAKGELYAKHVDPIALKTPGTNLTASGALGALNDTVTINAEGSGGISFEIDTGTLVGVVSFEATLDDTNWFGIQALLTTGTVNNSVASFPSRGTFTNVTYSQVRLRVSTFTSGTSNARLESSVGSSPIVLLGAALPAGANSIGSVLAQGFNAQDIAISGNPLNVGFRASTAIPTAMSADGDSVYGWANRNGAPVVTCAPHVGLNSDPWNLVHEAAQYTTQQTSTVLIAGGASEKIVVTKVQIQAFATTTFDLQLYFGTGAFSRGTSRACFDGTFKPSATLAPGVVMDGPFIAGTNGDDLLVTTSAAGSVTINVWYYVVT